MNRKKDAALAFTALVLTLLILVGIGQYGLQAQIIGGASPKLVDVALDGTETANSIGRAVRQLFLEATVAAPVTNSMADRIIAAGGSYAPMVLSTASPESIGVHLAAVAVVAPVSVASAIDVVYYIPFTINRATTVAQFFTFNGATAAGNTDIGIFSAAGARLTNSGNTAQSGTTNVQLFNITDYALPAGQYYLAVVNDNATATFFTFNAASYIMFKTMGVLEQTVGAGTGLPATATFATFARAYVPLIGFTSQTVM